MLKIFPLCKPSIQNKIRFIIFIWNCYGLPLLLFKFVYKYFLKLHSFKVKSMKQGIFRKVCFLFFSLSLLILPNFSKKEIHICLYWNIQMCFHSLIKSSLLCTFFYVWLFSHTLYPGIIPHQISDIFLFLQMHTFLLFEFAIYYSISPLLVNIEVYSFSIKKFHWMWMCKSIWIQVYLI